MGTTTTFKKSSGKTLLLEKKRIVIVDLVAVATKVISQWDKRRRIKLIWISPEEFARKTAKLKFLNENKLTGSKRKLIIAEELMSLDRKININLRYVLNYIDELYVDSAIRYYPFFGIIYENKAYRIPKGYTKRSEALEMLVNALSEYNLDEKEFGTLYWRGIYEQYTDLLLRNFNKFGEGSREVSNLIPIKKDIRLVIKSLIRLIKANYPYTYKSELKKWGFKKDRF